MRYRQTWCWVLVAAALPLTAAFADGFKLKLVPTGFTAKVGGYMPQRIALSAEKPEGLKKAPEMTAPTYGQLKLGAEAPYLIALDEPEGKDSKLYVDANRNGDLTDDKPTQWQKRPYKGQGGEDYAQYMGGASVEIQDDGKTVPVHVVMYRFDKDDKLRVALKDTLLYYNDFGREGEVKLGDKTYKVMLHDLAGTGDYSKVAEGNAPGVRFLIDANGNGEFERRGEVYSTGKPFNIAGTTYELKNIAPSGGSLEIVKSTQTVEEILPPPDLSVGKPILAFAAKTTDEKMVNFPSSYKGKLVMLDFWATWCGPCKAELPNLTAAYKKYHEKGFDVLSVSLDRENWAEKLAAFTKEHDMPWPQIYDGKYWSAEIAQKFGVDSIPRAFLVDGTTGKIVAEGNSLRGEALDATISKALANRS